MKINILGCGITKFGELWDKDLLNLSLEASLEALNSANIDKNSIDAVMVGNMLYGKTSNQDHLGALVASNLGLNCSSLRVEAACASGGVAVHQAILGLESGLYQNILVLGVEKMTDVDTSSVSQFLMGAASKEELTAGLTFPALYSLMAKAHIQKYQTKRTHLAQVAVKNHFHSSLNPNAQFPFEISIEKVLNSSPVADPLNLLDCSPISDGAAAVVLSSTQKSEVAIVGSAIASDYLGLSQRDSLTEIKATQLASKKALKQAGVEIKDISLAEVHDCFTIAEILAMEDLGFCPKGQGGEFIFSGKTKLGSKLAVNTSGGLKGCGHPIGATGVKQIIEIYDQLKGQAGKRQVKNPKLGLTHNVGGTGGTVAVHILQGGFK